MVRIAETTSDKLAATSVGAADSEAARFFNEQLDVGGRGARSGDGRLTGAELDLLNSVGNNTVYAADANGDGVISQLEFERFYDAVTDPEMVAAFDALDLNKDGVLTRDDGLTAEQLTALETGGGGAVDGVVRISETSR